MRCSTVALTLTALAATVSAAPRVYSRASYEGEPFDLVNCPGEGGGADTCRYEVEVCCRLLSSVVFGTC